MKKSNFMALFVRYLCLICFLTLSTFTSKTYISYWDLTLREAPVIHQILEMLAVHTIPLTLTLTCNVCSSSVLKTNLKKIRLKKTREMRNGRKKQKKGKNQKLIESLQENKGKKKEKREKLLLLKMHKMKSHSKHLCHTL